MVVSKKLVSHRALIAALTAFLIAAPQHSRAATATGPLAITATVLSLCTVAATPIIFGNYNATSGNTGQSTLTVICTAGTPFTIALDNGIGSGATTNARVMTGVPSGALTYSLYQDSGYSQVWGNNTGTNTEAGTGNGLLSTFTVYGKIPAAQFPGPGAYADAVTVTLTY